MMIGRAEIGFKHAFELSRDGAAHQHQRVDRKEGVLPKFRDVMAPNEALGLERLVFRLVLDSAKRVERRHVAGPLEDAAKQNRDIFEFHAGAPFDSRKDQFRQVSVRAAEIEQELNFQGHVSSSRRAKWMIGFGDLLAEPWLLFVHTVLKLNCQTYAEFC